MVARAKAASSWPWLAELLKLAVMLVSAHAAVDTLASARGVPAAPAVARALRPLHATDGDWATSRWTNSAPYTLFWNDAIDSFLPFLPRFGRFKAPDKRTAISANVSDPPGLCR